MDRNPTRRRVLALVASGSVVGAAGCGSNSSDSRSSPPDARTPEPTPTEVPCDPAAYSSLSSERPPGAWTPTRGNQRRTGANSDVEPLGLEDVDEFEATELISHDRVTPPTIADGTLYVMNDGGRTFAVDVAGDGPDWAVETDGWPRLTPIVTRDTTYVLGRERVSAVERASGDVRWRGRPDREGWYEIDPVVADGTVVVGGARRDDDDQTHGWYAGLDARCGAERWSFALEGDRPRGLATDGETVYATTNHDLYALDPADGAERWRVTVGGDREIARPPAVAGDAIILQKHSDHLVALSTEDGGERWATRGGFEVKHLPAVTADAVYAVEAESNDVVALDPDAGDTLWRYADGPGAVYSSLTFASGVLYGMVDIDETDQLGILALDAERGTKRADAAIPSRMETQAETSDELAVTADGIVIHSHAIEDGTPEYVHRLYVD